MQDKSIIKQNILKYLDFIGVSQYKFYKKTGITRGVLAQNNGMSEENITRFLDHYKNINTEWLLSGKGEMLKSIYRNVDMVNETQARYDKEEKIIEALKTEISYKDIIIAGLERENKLLWKLVDGDDTSNGKKQIG